MTRPLDLSRPVRCAKCGEKFTRGHGREKLCLGCKRPDKRALTAAKAVAAAGQRRAAIEDGSDCQYPACGHSLRKRAIDLSSGACRPR